MEPIQQSQVSLTRQKPFTGHQPLSTNFKCSPQDYHRPLFSPSCNQFSAACSQPEIPSAAFFPEGLSFPQDETVHFSASPETPPSSTKYRMLSASLTSNIQSQPGTVDKFDELIRRRKLPATRSPRDVLERDALDRLARSTRYDIVRQQPAPYPNLPPSLLPNLPITHRPLVWPQSLLLAFATTLQDNFPFSKFADENGLATEDVFTVFSALVHAPILDFQTGVAQLRLQQWQRVEKELCKARSESS
jgi:hypothetical protein